PASSAHSTGGVAGRGAASVAVLKMVPLSPHLQRAGVHDVGGCAADEIDHVVEGGAEVQLVAFLFDVADVRGADAVFQPQQRVALQDGFALEDVDRGQAG